MSVLRCNRNNQFIEACCHFHGVFEEKFLSTILWTDVENMIQKQLLNLGVDFQNFLFLSFNRCCHDSENYYL